MVLTKHPKAELVDPVQLPLSVAPMLSGFAV